MRERLHIRADTVTPDGAGGSVVTRAYARLSLPATILVSKPTREEIASQTRLLQVIKVVTWAQAGLNLKAGTLIEWNNAEYALQGPPATIGNMGAVWEITAKATGASL